MGRWESGVHMPKTEDVALFMCWRGGGKLDLANKILPEFENTGAGNAET